MVVYSIPAGIESHFGKEIFDGLDKRLSTVRGGSRRAGAVAAHYRLEISSGIGKRQFPLLSRDSGEAQALPDIFIFQIRVFGNDLLLRQATGKQPQHRCDRYSQMANARDSAHLARINSDSVEVPHGYL
jgi:hypothetical protein